MSTFPSTSIWSNSLYSTPFSLQAAVCFCNLVHQPLMPSFKSIFTSENVVINFINMLKMDNLDLIWLSLSFFDCLSNEKELEMTFQENNGLSYLDAFQYHSNENIRSKSFQILQTFRIMPAWIVLMSFKYYCHKVIFHILIVIFMKYLYTMNWSDDLEFLILGVSHNFLLRRSSVKKFYTKNSFQIEWYILIRTKYSMYELSILFLISLSKCFVQRR